MASSDYLSRLAEAKQKVATIEQEKGLAANTLVTAAENAHQTNAAVADVVPSTLEANDSTTVQSLVDLMATDDYYRERLSTAQHTVDNIERNRDLQAGALSNILLDRQRMPL